MEQISMFGEPDRVAMKPRDKDYTPEFERLWSLHRRGGKRPAFRAFLRVIPRKITQAEVETFLESYLDRTDDQYTAHLSTWLNGEYWEQERELHPQNGKGPEPVGDGSAAEYY